MGKWWKRWLARLSRRRAGDERPCLVVNADGFSYAGGEDEAAVRWADVKEVFAFKFDLGAIDLICVGFRVSDEGEHFEIDEEMSGYREVVAAMEQAFPGLDSHWWDKVAYPAFATNLVTLWGQPKMASIWKQKG